MNFILLLFFSPRFHAREKSSAFSPMQADWSLSRIVKFDENLTERHLSPLRCAHPTPKFGKFIGADLMASALSQPRGYRKLDAASSQK